MGRGENIYKRKDGRWEGRYIKNRTSQGKIVYGYVYGRGCDEVRAKLLKKKLAYQQFYESSDKAAKSDIQLAAWVRCWLQQKETQVRSLTYLDYQRKMQNYVLPALGRYRLFELTNEGLRRYLTDLEKELSLTSVNKIYQLLSTCLESAVAENYLPVNPLSRIKPKISEKNEILFFSATEQERLTAAVDFKRDFPIYLALCTGLRLRELLHLRWSDVAWQQRALLVYRYLNVPEASTADSLVLTQRSIPLTAELLEQLAVWQELSGGSYVFANKKQQPMEARTLRYRFSKLKQTAAVADLPFHSLRHTFVMRCFEQGLSLAAISELLGHASPRVTFNIYQSVFKM